mmetsp:Transcript_23642/g.46288  ORF Transcript_23642/g.46288 Transcript_23642/m.46288 type:complete len:188 (+) Transcript_23642:748-1311(+)
MLITVRRLSTIGNVKGVKWTNTQIVRLGGCFIWTRTWSFQVENWPSFIKEQAKFDATKPTVFVMEGLLMYLDQSQQKRLFEKICSMSAPGSWVTGDFLTSSPTAAVLFCKEKFPLGIHDLVWYWSSWNDMLVTFSRAGFATVDLESVSSEKLAIPGSRFQPAHLTSDKVYRVFSMKAKSEVKGALMR